MDKRLVLLVLLLGLTGTTAFGGLRDGLVAWWRFEGNFNDSAGTNHGTPMGDAQIVTDTERGRVVQFDGSGDYVEVPHSDSLNLTGNQVSMTAWVNFNSVGPVQIVLAKVFNNSTHASPYFSYGLHMLANGQPRVWISRTGGAAYQPGATGMFKNGTWHHMAGVYDGAQLKLYIDGVLAAASNVSGNLIPYDTVLRLGTNGGLTEQLAGKLDDVRVYNRPLSEEEIAAIMAGVGSDIGVATEPKPAVDAVDVPFDATLGWTAGEFAATHDVYLGKTFADVNSAGRTDPLGVLVSQGQTATAYDTDGQLEFGQTYFWRIDEVNAAPDNTIFRGQVWSFTVEPYSYPIQGVTATASGTQAGTNPANTINGSGLNDHDEHSTDVLQTWMSTPGLPCWIQYEFDKPYKLDEMWVWNSNQLIEAFMGFGAKNVAVEHSLDGATWTRLDGTPEFAQATGLATYTANTVVDLGGVLARYVRLTITSNWGGIAPQAGLSEVRFFSIPVQAREPQPAVAATDVAIDTELNWRPGREAESHEVYFGADADALALVDTVTDHAYAPASLDYGTTYFWKVDEVGGGGPYEGEVWSFTTQAYTTVDDFEGYNDDDNRIYNAWIDGLTDPAMGGSQVGYDVSPFAEKTVIYGGKQSMPLIYNGPRSEAECTFDPPQDWSRHGVTALVLFFRGDPANAGAPLYVKINGAKATYNNGAAGTTSPFWKQWNIDLASLGVNLKSVRTLTIGVGDGASSAAGTLFIDEIRLYAAPPQADVPTDPGNNGLVAWWAFEGDFRDSAGTNHGAAKGDVQIVTDDRRGRVAAFDGTGDYVEVPHSPSLHITDDKVSLAAWVNFDSVAYTQMIVCKVFNNTTHASPYFSYGLHTLTNGQPRFWISRAAGAAYQPGAAGMFKVQTWHHIAGVYDGAQLKLYLDGALAASSNVTGNLLGYDTVLRLGTNGGLTEQLNGKLDDVRIYHRALSEMEIRYLYGDR